MNSLSELDIWRIKRRLAAGEDVRAIAGAYRIYWRAVQEIYREMQRERIQRPPDSSSNPDTSD